MAYNVTLSELQARVRERTDTTNQTAYLTDTELTRHINASIAELYNIIVGKYQDYFIVRNTSPTVSAGVMTMPSDFMKLVSIRMRRDDGYYVSLLPMSWREWELNPDTTYRHPTHYILYGGGDFSSGIGGEPDASGYTYAQLVPEPAGTLSYELVYIPVPPKLDLETTTQMNFIAGWDDYVVADASMKIKDRMEDDVSVLLAEKQAKLEAFENNMSPVETGGVHTVATLQHRSRYFGFEDDLW